MRDGARGKRHPTISKKRPLRVLRGEVMSERDVAMISGSHKTTSTFQRLRDNHGRDELAAGQLARR